MIEVDKVFEEISDRIASVAGVAWVDEDRGQIEEIMSENPGEHVIPFPAVFLSAEDVQWEDVGNAVQRGKAVLRVKIALWEWRDTYQTSPERVFSMTDREIIKNIHGVLHKFSGTNFDKLVRINSRKEADTHPLYVYSMAYACTINDNSIYDGPTQEADVPMYIERGDIVRTIGPSNYIID